MLEYNPVHQTWLTMQPSRGRISIQGALRPTLLDDIWEFDMNGVLQREERKKSTRPCEYPLPLPPTHTHAVIKPSPMIQRAPVRHSKPWGVYEHGGLGVQKDYSPLNAPVEDPKASQDMERGRGAAIPDKRQASPEGREPEASPQSNVRGPEGLRSRQETGEPQAAEDLNSFPLSGANTRCSMRNTHLVPSNPQHPVHLRREEQVL